MTALLPTTLLPTTTIAGVRPAAGAEDPLQGLDGLVGAAARVIEALGEVGVGAMTFIETVFPPIPSEVVLPLAGFVAATGRMNLVLVIVASTLGAYLGALLLYWLGRKAGEERTIRVLARLPLVERHDFEVAAAWFHRHGRSAVFFGRLVPGVRSLISLPAGAAGMHLGTFSSYTIAGSGLWNGALIGLGAALGSQYELIDRYAQYLDYAVYGVLGILLLLLVGRALRRRAQRGRAARDR
ncbi:membrane protein DedA with SNARE-associated domain [Clavibacter michiganensis]|uniref:DedA family protein n=1 Tax=Clavibacter michiganensis TaxID=28447 RepID=UPI001E01D35B|nr:membrane protein DedA with SNARE-associated domain [Clavibacter michiganensis]